MNDLGIKIYADGADVNEIIKMSNDDFIDGFTKFINQITKLGFKKKEIEYMIKINSKNLFNL